MKLQREGGAVARHAADGGAASIHAETSPRSRVATAASAPRVVKRSAAQLPRFVKPLVWLGALLPATILLVRFFLDDLGANPIETVTNWTGYTTLSLLTTALAVSPIRRLTGFNPLIKLRRLIGLFAFFYACLHFLTYIVLDQFFAFEYIIEDIVERPYITVGFTAFVLLIPLAITSTTGWIRRLGKRWTQLHRLLYVIVPLGVLHFYWKVISKAFQIDVLVFFILVGLLLVLRLPAFRRSVTNRVRPRAGVVERRPG
ncbi:MAG: sulfite oxidase heme-binding subunit YedZ [Longimicrobiales bacterium]